MSSRSIDQFNGMVRSHGGDRAPAQAGRVGRPRTYRPPVDNAGSCHSSAAEALQPSRTSGRLFACWGSRLAPSREVRVPCRPARGRLAQLVRALP